MERALQKRGSPVSPCLVAGSRDQPQPSGVTLIKARPSERPAWWGGLESHAVRVLFASTQGAGHFGPLIPFIDACTRQGHEALIVGPPALKARGYEFRAGAAPPDEILGPLWGRMPSPLPPAQGDLVVVGQIFAGLNVDAMLPTLERTIEEWKPDLVLREAAEFASAIAADRRGLRHVRVSAGVALFEEASIAVAAPALEERQPGIARRIADSPYLSYLPAAVDPSPFPVTGSATRQPR